MKLLDYSHDLFSLEVRFAIAGTVGEECQTAEARGSNPTRHAPFCRPRHPSFVLALGSLLLCDSRVTFFVYSHNATLRLNKYVKATVTTSSVQKHHWSA